MNDAPAPETSSKPSFSEAAKFWVKLGFISFGGPSGQIAIMHSELVDRRRWISNDRFLHALNYCMLLPGPEAQQLATYCGWLLHGRWGGLVAGVMFVLPSFFILGALSYVYVEYGHIAWVASLFYGLKAAVLAIVAHAVIRIGQKALKTPLMWSLAMSAFILIFFAGVPFPMIIIGAAVFGWTIGTWKPGWFPALAQRNGRAGDTSDPSAPLIAWKRVVRTLVSGLLAWWGPILLVGLLLGWESTWFKQGIFFSKVAIVTFGGAYAVLPYVSQQAVDNYGWLEPGQMMDGLGLAETTPGPLVMVLEFVGFLGGYKYPEPFTPMVGATLGAAITTWATFAPCFLWIFLGAPFIERLRGVHGLTRSLSAVTAAVVGVILNLAVWFGLHLLWRESGLDAFALIVATLSFLLLQRFKLDVLWVVALGAGAGLFHWAFIA